MVFVKKFSTLILAAILVMTSAVCFGCSSANNDNSETTIDQKTSEKSTSVNLTEETYPTNNTAPTIKAGETEKENKENVIQILNDNGFHETSIRKKYEFDDKKLNTKNNKNYVVDKMGNSIDYFTTLQASYIKKDNMGVSWVTYAVDQRVKKAKELVYSFNSNDDSWTPSQYRAVNGNKHLSYTFEKEAKEKYTIASSESPDSKTIYEVTEIIKTPLAKELKSRTSNIQENINTYDETDAMYYVDATERLFCEHPYGYRRNNNIALTISNDHYLPDLFVIETLNDYSSWSIDEVKMINGTEVICLSGNFKLDDTFDRTFRLSIDKNTGVIMSKQISDESENIIEEWNTVNYVVNREIDESIFDTLEPKTE